MRKFSIIYLHKLKSNIFRATFFGITSLLLYAFLTYLHESKTTVQQKKIHVQGQQDKNNNKNCKMCIKVTVKRVRDTGASSLDVVLMSLLLTFNTGIV